MPSLAEPSSVLFRCLAQAGAARGSENRPVINFPAAGGWWFWHIRGCVFPWSGEQTIETRGLGRERGEGRGSGAPAGTLCRSAPLSPGGSQQNSPPPPIQPKPRGAPGIWVGPRSRRMQPPAQRGCLAKCHIGGPALASYVMARAQES